MLQPNPEKGSLTEVKEKFIRSAQLIGERVVGRSVEIVSKNHLKITAGLALGATALGGYWTDVYNNQEIRANASISISVEGPPVDKANSNSAILFIPAFGETNASVEAKYLGPVLQQITDGEVLSLNLGNAPLDENVVIGKAEKIAEDKGYDRLTLAGYSTGGVIAINIAPELIASDGPQIPAIVPISTPDGYEGLRPKRKIEIQVAKIVDSIPGAKYSTYVRFLGELYFRRDQFNKGDFKTRLANYFKTMGNIWRDMHKKDNPGTWLLVDQVLTVADADLKGDYQKINKADSSRLRPVTMALGTAKPGYDYMVNNFYSNDRICNYADSVSLKCFTYNVPGAVHTRPDEKHKEYMQTVAKASPQVKAALKQAQSYYSMQNLRIPTKIPR